jgi:hypothetical protein
MKHYTPEQIQQLPLPELRLAVAERLGIECRLFEAWKSSPEIFSMIGEIEFNAEWSVDREWLEAGTPVQMLENGGIKELPDWASDLNACAANFKIPGYDIMIRIFTDPPDIPDVSYVVAEYWPQSRHDKNGKEIVVIKASGATEAEARTRAWLAAMQEQEETNV